MKIYAAFFAVVMATLLMTMQPREYSMNKQAYLVKPRDTLWTIAEQYFDKQNKYRHFGEFVYSIGAYNHLGKYIYPGQVIIVPLEVEK